MSKKKLPVGRREFLRTAAAGSVASLVATTGALASDSATPPKSAPGKAPVMPREADPAVEVLTNGRPGSDFMVDVMKSLDFEFVAANPGSSFRGIHESVINYGGNKAPELITCAHEEASVALAHGYAKIEGKPMATFVHSTVGLQHAAMAIYNAYCDQVPVCIMPGNGLDAVLRRPGVEWNHTALDVAAMVRDFVKWDDLPVSLQHFAESTVRAYRIAMTPPMMPVLIVIDGDLQERPISPDDSPRIPRLTVEEPPQGDSGSVAEAARLLVAAENPVIVADRSARTAAGLTRLIELAEALQAPVIDQNSRMNFPSRHPLNHTERARELISGADVILGLEVGDFWGTVNNYRDQLTRSSSPAIKTGTKLISINAGDLYMKGNFQNIERYTEIDLAIAADAETTMPSLAEAIKRLTSDDRKRAFQERGKNLADAHQKAFERAKTAATYGWDSSPISTARLSAEIWGQIQNEDWSLVSEVGFLSRWPLRLWDFNKYYQFAGGAGGAGVGYGAPAATGAALANRKHGRVTVNIQCDGDLMFSPGVLWTQAHHKIPLLSIMHNNRAWHQETMHIQRMADRHERGITRAGIGTTITEPNIDFAKMAQSMGVYGEGPISDPKELGPAIRRALDVVKRGEPALVDVITEPR